MDIWVNILEIIKTSMTVPKPWGWFHILWLVISIAAAFIPATRPDPVDST